MKFLSKFKIFCILTVVVGIFLFVNYKTDAYFVTTDVNNFNEPEQIALKEIKILLTIAGTKFDVTLVNTPALREKGLGDRLSLSPKEGMLFVFETDDYYAFWMKDMNFSIDIIWIDAENKVVDFVEQVDPNTYPQSFVPKKPARRVLELQAGMIHKIGIKIGDQVNY